MKLRFTYLFIYFCWQGRVRNPFRMLSTSREAKYFSVLDRYVYIYLLSSKKSVIRQAKTPKNIFPSTFNREMRRTFFFRIHRFRYPNTIHLALFSGHNIVLPRPLEEASKYFENARTIFATFTWYSYYTRCTFCMRPADKLLHLPWFYLAILKRDFWMLELLIQQDKSYASSFRVHLVHWNVEGAFRGIKMVRTMMKLKQWVIDNEILSETIWLLDPN